MSLTALAPNSNQVSSGLISPVGTPPPDPTLSNLYYQLDSLGNVIGIFLWDVTSQQWHAQAMNGSNWSEGLECGWVGAHNAKHLAPTPAVVALASALTPHFGVAKISVSPIPFELHDQASGTPNLVATGVFPAGAVHASAASCSLVDASSNPVASFLFAPTGTTPVAHFTATPVGGHAAMPTDGETFITSFSALY